jgi:purine-cytosine permease-like protein
MATATAMTTMRILTILALRFASGSVFSLLVLVEISLLSVGYTLTPWSFVWLILLLVRKRRRPENETRVPSSDPEQDISQASPLELRQAFAVKVEEIKSKIIGAPTTAAVNREEPDEESRRSDEWDIQG